MTYIIGHQSPDLDSVAAAISYAVFKKKSGEQKGCIPAVCGEVNKETKYILDKFGFTKPETLEDASEKELILVDHNEFSQAVNGVEKAKIREVLDHHKVNFSYSEAIPFKVLPWGSSCSIIAQDFFNKNIEIDKNSAGLMLAAILVDTVITKSPTCTDKDKEIIAKLASIARVEDWQEFGMEIFKVRSSVNELSSMEIIKSDFKDFDFNGNKVGIGQVETVDLEEFKDKEDELVVKLKELQNSQDYHSVVLFITDIIKEGSRFLVATKDADIIEKALGKQLENNRVYAEGIMSRKKQVVPNFIGAFQG